MVTDASAAGMQPFVVPANAGAAEIRGMLWTPCAQPTTTDTPLGPYAVHATRGCPVAGQHLPLIVISHGQGGSALGHHDTASALADAGFVVASFNQPGDNYEDDAQAQQLRIFESRPRDASRVIDWMLGQWPQRDRLNAKAIGAFGFSRGGYTVLALAGAKPQTAAAKQRLCGTWWSWLVYGLCRQLGSDVRIAPAADPRIRAIVSVDPLNLFDAAGLRNVRVPVQLWASEQGGDGVALAHIEAIRTALAQAPDYHVARGAGHFAYLAPCPPAFAREAKRLCTDPPGFDRVRWHRQMNAEVVRFFRLQLASPDGHASSRGHGMSPDMNPDRVAVLVDEVHAGNAH